jgi:hypothetical protein
VESESAERIFQNEKNDIKSKKTLLHSSKYKFDLETYIYSKAVMWCL